METLFYLALGVSLSAACGFRVFVPMLGYGLAVRAGQFTPMFGWDWIGSNAALAVCALATMVEIAAYLIPILDHALDLAAVPLATVAGTMITGSLLSGEMSPVMCWSLALIAGGTVAGGTATAAGVTRAAVTATTGGIGNPVFSLAESAAAVFGSALALFAPFLAVLLFALSIFGVLRLARKLRRRKARKAAPVLEPL